MKRLILFALLLFALPVSAQETQLSIVTPNTHFNVGDEFTVEVQLEAAPDLYGYELEMTFDPAVVEVRDVDDETGGVQLASGSFFATATDGSTFLLQNMADNDVGTVRYAIVLVNPAPPVAGTGTLISIPFRAKTNGKVALAITDSQLGTKSADFVPHSIVETDIRIGANAIWTYLLIAGLILFLTGLVGVILYRRTPPPPPLVAQGA